MRICVTGGIACGKSVVGSMLARKGLAVAEADQVCADLLRPGGRLQRRIVSAFGRRILTAGGGLDRARLARIVFADARRRARLNRLVHPPARREIMRWLRDGPARGRRGAGAAVVVPLAYEANWLKPWDWIICVAAPEPVQLARLRARGLSARDARARIAAQWPVEEKMRRADYVVFNTGTLGNLRAQVETVLAEIAATGKQKHNRERYNGR